MVSKHMRLEPDELRRVLEGSSTSAPWQQTLGRSLTELSDQQFLEMFFPERFFYTERKLNEATTREVKRIIAENSGPILEIGSGAGNLTRILAYSGIKDIVGLDFDDAATECARSISEAEDLDITFVQGNYTSDDSFRSEKYSVILCISVLEHIVEYKEWIELMYQDLLPGGAVVLGVPSVLGGWSLTHDFDWRHLRWKAQPFNYHPGQHCNHIWFRELVADFAASGFVLEMVYKNQAYLAPAAYVLHRLRLRRFVRPLSRLDYWVSQILPNDLATRLCIFRRPFE